MPNTATQADFLELARRHQAELADLKSRRYSDVVDDLGHQYIDLVMEGGGTLGIALLGYIHALEEVGIRFIGIGGTSAGAISAIALAAAAKPAEPRMAPLMDVLANMPMLSFVDGRKHGDDDAVDALNAFLDDRNMLVKVARCMQVLDNLREIHALNRGEVFQTWIRDLLKQFNGGQALTVAALRARMTDLPPLWLTDDADDADFENDSACPYVRLSSGRRQLSVPKDKDHLCVITADISTETKVELPRMAKLYWDDPEQADVAEFARASMSIPGFFSTYQRAPLPLELARERWQNMFSTSRPGHTFEGDFLPARHHFVDGGVLSNFPIKAFHRPNRVPLRPTFGVKLQWDEYKHEIKGLSDVVKQSFNSARHALDIEFITENPDFGRLVAFIDTQEIGWLDFNMARDTKLRLFEMGMKAAIEFLGQFDWTGYKQVRRALAPIKAAPKAV